MWSVMIRRQVQVQVGVDGQVIHSYKQSQTSDVKLASLAVTKNDDILVADLYNSRIVRIVIFHGPRA